MSAAFGNLEWGRRSSGVLSGRERTRYVLHAVSYQLAEWSRFFTAAQRRRLTAIDFDRLVIPDSAIARSAEELCRESSPDFLLNHCIRTYIWGAILSKADRLSHDPELLYVAALLHDLGHTEKHQSCDRQHCFAITGAEGALEFLTRQKWDSAKSRKAANAIAMHANLAPALKSEFPEARLLQAGAAFDVIGTRHQEVNRALIDHVVRQYPRHQFAERFSDLMENESSKWPGTRADVMVRLQLRKRARRAPYASP